MTARAVSIGEACELLGIERPNAVQWLRRRIHRAEKRTGRKVLERRDSSASRPSYRVSMMALRDVCPELFREVSPALAAMLTERDARKREQGDKTRRVQGEFQRATLAKLARLEEQVETMCALVSELLGVA